MDKRVAIAILLLIPATVFAMNTPMGSGADMGIHSNTYISVGVGGVEWYAMLDNDPRGTVVVIAKHSGSTITNVFGYDFLVGTTKENGPLQTFFCGIDKEGRAQQYFRRGGSHFGRTFWFPPWADGAGPGIANEWHIWVFASDNTNNFVWLDGVASISNDVWVSSEDTKAWFNDSVRSSGIGANQQPRTETYTDGLHFKGTIELVVTYTEVLTSDEIERLTNTKGRWLPRRALYNLWSGLNNYGYGTELANGITNCMVNYGAQTYLAASTNQFTGVTAADSYRRRRRRQ